MTKHKFDILYGEHGPRPDYHFCRDWDESGGCYGTNPNHGFTWEEAREEIAKYHDEQATYWRQLEHDTWNPPDDGDE